MRKLLAVSLLLFAACSSSSSKSAKAPVTSPEIRIVQTRGIPPAARHIAGSIPVRYAVRVTNRATEPITIRNIAAQSIAEGAYELRPTTLPFNEQIAPGAHGDVEFWADAVVTNPSMLGANGPVTLRLIVHFDSPKGGFDEVVVRQVNETGSGKEPLH
jgi:hypothetical protein